jgi:hypothetical protein
VVLQIGTALVARSAETFSYRAPTLFPGSLHVRGQSRILLPSGVANAYVSYVSLNTWVSFQGLYLGDSELTTIRFREVATTTTTTLLREFECDDLTLFPGSNCSGCDVVECLLPSGLALADTSLPVAYEFRVMLGTISPAMSDTSLDRLIYPSTPTQTRLRSDDCLTAGNSVDHCPTTGGATLTLTGTNFVPGMMSLQVLLLIGSVDCADVIVRIQTLAAADNRLTFTLPPGTGERVRLMLSLTITDEANDVLVLDSPDPLTFGYAPPVITALLSDFCTRVSGTVLEDCQIANDVQRPFITIVGTDLGRSGIALVGGLVCPPHDDPNKVSNETRYVCYLPEVQMVKGAVSFFQQGGAYYAGNSFTVSTTACPLGQEIVDGFCIDCTAGRFRASGDTCVECQSSVDFQMFEGEDHCDACPVNSKFSLGHTSCECKAGFFKLDSAYVEQFSELDPTGYENYLNGVGVNPITGVNVNDLLGFWCVPCPEGSNCRTSGADGTEFCAVPDATKICLAPAHGYFVDATTGPMSGLAFFQCLNDACLGSGECVDGYIGSMCTICNGEGLVLVDFECQYCLPAWTGWLVLVGCCLLFLGYIVWRVWDARNEGYRSRDVYFKIMVSACQVNGLALSYSFSWDDVMGSYLGAVASASSMGTAYLNFQCLDVPLLDSSPFFQESVIYMVGPVALAFGLFAFNFCRAKRALGRDPKRIPLDPALSSTSPAPSTTDPTNNPVNATDPHIPPNPSAGSGSGSVAAPVSNVGAAAGAALADTAGVMSVFMFVMLPTLVGRFALIFSCVKLGADDTDYFMHENLDVRCWTSRTHQAYILCLGVPFLVLYVVGTPFVFYRLLNSHAFTVKQIISQLTPKTTVAHSISRGSVPLTLTNQQAKVALGENLLFYRNYSFLFLGYKENKYAWELVVMARKVLIALIGVGSTAHIQL